MSLYASVHERRVVVVLQWSVEATPLSVFEGRNYARISYPECTVCKTKQLTKYCRVAGIIREFLYVIYFISKRLFFHLILICVFIAACFSRDHHQISNEVFKLFSP